MQFTINLCRVDETGRITHMAGVPATAKNPEPECTPETIAWCPVDPPKRNGDFDAVRELRAAIDLFNAYNWNLPPTPTAAHPIDFDNVRQIMNPHGGGPHTCECAGMARAFIENMLAFPRFATPGGTIELGGADYLTASETAGRGKRKRAAGMADDFKSVDEMLADAERRECGFTRRVAAFNSYVDWLGVHAGCGRAAQGVIVAVDRLVECLRECGIRETAHIERAAADVISALAELCRALGEAESGLANRDGNNSTLARIDDNTRELPTMKAAIDYLVGKKKDRSTKAKEAQAKAVADPDTSKKKERAAADMETAMKRVANDPEVKAKKHGAVLTACRRLCDWKDDAGNLHHGKFTEITSSKKYGEKEYLPLMDWQDKPVQPETLAKNFRTKYGTMEERRARARKPDTQ